MATIDNIVINFSDRTAFICTEIRQISFSVNKTDCESNESNEAKELIYSLTKKEKIVLDYICLGLTNKKIAAELKLSLSSIENRRTRIMKKLGVTNVVELINKLNSR
jgi:DNA-binding NarL/FixJ family response regulator